MLPNWKISPEIFSFKWDPILLDNWDNKKREIGKGEIRNYGTTKKSGAERFDFRSRLQRILPIFHRHRKNSFYSRLTSINFISTDFGLSREKAMLIKLWRNTIRPMASFSKYFQIKWIFRCGFRDPPKLSWRRLQTASPSTLIAFNGVATTSNESEMPEELAFLGGIGLRWSHALFNYQSNHTFLRLLGADRNQLWTQAVAAEIIGGDEVLPTV